MNPGNINPKTPNSVDRAVERLNQKIARMLGKNKQVSNIPEPKKTSNFAFSIMIIGCTIMLWLTTGFYYLGENQFGVILQNGKIVSVVKGIKVGFTAPYPFGNIEVINGDISNFIDLSTLSDSGFSILSRDVAMIKVDAKFNYQVYDPSILFRTVLQKQSSMDNLVSIIVQNELHHYFSNKLKNDILRANLTVLSSEVRDLINARLSAYGIKIVKLNINSLHDVSNPPAALVNNVESLSVADNLLKEAQEYQQNTIRDTNSAIAEFKQLLPEYKQDPLFTVNKMYDDVRSAIPVNNPFILLNMKLEDLIMLNQRVPESVPVLHMRERHFDRSVNRERNGRDLSTYGNDDVNGDQNNGS
jgi:regulator of protease activity HflC (stomatin/prohibitin superfamily)